MGYYRFYPDGFVNYFITDNDSDLNVRDFNPNRTGFRGVYYLDKKGKISIDLFTQTTGWGKYSISKRTVTFSNDSMFVTQAGMNDSYRVFIKTKMTPKIQSRYRWFD